MEAFLFFYGLAMISAIAHDLAREKTEEETTYHHERDGGNIIWDPELKAWVCETCGYSWKELKVTIENPE